MPADSQALLYALLQQQPQYAGGSGTGAGFAQAGAVIGDAIRRYRTKQELEEQKKKRAGGLANLLADSDVPPEFGDPFIALGEEDELIKALVKQRFPDAPQAITPFQQEDLKLRREGLGLARETKRGRLELDREKARRPKEPKAARQEPLVEVFDENSPTGTRFVPRSQAVGKAGKPASSMSIETGPDGTVRVTQGRARAEDAKAAAAAAKAAGRQEQKAQTADIVTQDIDRALGMIERPDWELPRTGAAGQALSGVGGTAAHDLSQMLLGIQANIGMDRLQEMRDNSPTGGALGDVTVKEMQRLEAVLGSIVQSQSDDQLRSNLQRLKQLYNQTVHGGAPVSAATPSAGAAGAADAGAGTDPESILKRYGL